MYWVVVSQLRRLDAWLVPLDSKGQKWQFQEQYMLRVHRQVTQGELPLVSTWLEIEAAEKADPTVSPTGKTL